LLWIIEDVFLRTANSLVLSKQSTWSNHSHWINTWHNYAVFDFSRIFRGVNTDFFFNFSDIFLISPTSDPSDFLLNRAVPIFAPGKVAQRSIYNWNIVEKWRLNTHSLIWIIAIKYRLSNEIDINYFPVYLLYLIIKYIL
jgi:hypothetical protein